MGNAPDATAAVATLIAPPPYLVDLPESPAVRGACAHLSEASTLLSI